MKYLLIASLFLLTACEDLSRYQPPQAAPVVTLSAEATQGAAPFTTEFILDVQDEDSAELDCVLEFGDAQRVEKERCAGRTNLFHTYDAPGTYQARLSVTDGKTSALAETSINVVASSEDDVELLFTATPERGNAPLIVEFEWTSTGLSGQSCVLDFGEGETQEIENCDQVTNTFHTFESPGGFVVTLTFGDVAGRSIGILVE